jgi:hypothetical protein
MTRKPFLALSIFIVLLMCLSCNESIISVYTLKIDDFKAESTDSLFIEIETRGNEMLLEGTVDLEEGECHLLLYNPDSLIVYEERFDVLGKFKIEERFERELGQWRLYFYMNKYEEYNPLGSVDVSISYND